MSGFNSRACRSQGLIVSVRHILYSTLNDISAFLFAVISETWYLILFGAAVIKLLVCGVSGWGSIPSLAATISEIGYLLLPSRDMAEISLKRHKSSK